MKPTSRRGEEAVAGLNETLWVKAAGQKLLRTTRIRADTTVIPANEVAQRNQIGTRTRYTGWPPPRRG